MSDPSHLRRMEQIARLLAALGDYWRARPELRLGQILHDLAAGDEAVSDEALEKRLGGGRSPSFFR